MLNLRDWDRISADERWIRCTDLTKTIPGEPSLAAAYVTVTLLQMLPGGLERGQTLGLPPAEAAALVTAGFAST